MNYILLESRRVNRIQFFLIILGLIGLLFDSSSFDRAMFGQSFSLIVVLILIEIFLRVELEIRERIKKYFYWVFVVQIAVLCLFLTIISLPLLALVAFGKLSSFLILVFVIRIIYILRQCYVMILKVPKC